MDDLNEALAVALYPRLSFTHTIYDNGNIEKDHQTMLNVVSVLLMAGADYPVPFLIFENTEFSFPN